MINITPFQTYGSDTLPDTVFGAFSQGEDLAVWKRGAGATREILALKRVQAKPTSVFPGVERLELKRTNYVTVNGVEYVAVATLNTSIPVLMSLADRTSFYKKFAMIMRDAAFQTAAETGAIPT